MGSLNSTTKDNKTLLSNTRVVATKIEIDLYDAVRLKQCDQVNELLDKNANYNIFIKDGHTALSLAIHIKHFGIIDAFTNISKLCERIDNGFPKKQLLYHLIKGDPGKVKRILKESSEFGSYNTEQYFTKKYERVVDPNFTVSKFRITPLHIAVISKDYEMIQLLINHGAKINILDINHDTPLMYAASIQNEQMIRFLLLRKANPGIKNKNGKKAKDFLLPEKINLTNLLNTVESIPLLILAHRNDPNSTLHKTNLAPDIFNTIIKFLRYSVIC